ncbi:MAG TPA: YfiR family protein [Lacunisphaera sp.]|nr:YfiR family protein [Lacunisphaera sp.]
MTFRPSTAWSLRPAAAALLALVLAGSLAAQRSREYDLKAVFLFNFTTFVEWPEDARPKPGQPLIIGILGRDPFGRVLDDVVAGEKLQDNPLQVRRYRTVEAAQEAQVLYISSSEAERMPQILHFLRDKPVLTVADMPHAAGTEAVISFATGNHIQLQVNPAAAQRAGLNISSKLLRVATLVGQNAVP